MTELVRAVRMQNNIFADNPAAMAELNAKVRAAYGMDGISDTAAEPEVSEQPAEQE